MTSRWLTARRATLHPLLLGSCDATCRCFLCGGASRAAPFSRNAAMPTPSGSALLARLLASMRNALP